MRYQGSEALNYRTTERRAVEERTHPSFEVVTGGGLDARARRGVTPEFLARVRSAVCIALVLIVLGACRVVLTTATVSLLLENSQLKTDIEEAQTLNGDLRVERSVLMSSTRINRIATQNYGMVHASEHDMIVILTPEQIAEQEAAAAAEAEAAAAAEAEVDEAAEADAAEADAETTDGDAMGEAETDAIVDPEA